MRVRLLLLALIPIVLAQSPQAQTSIHYNFSFPAPEHHWMQVDATFGGLGQAPLQLRMSRSSPGRYSLHAFAKNVYDVHAFGDDGKELAVSRPDAEGWDVPSHPSSVTMRYKVFGDLVDGTYLAIDRTHAHINMPASIMWARGLDDRPASLTFAVPDGVRWQIATQLHAGGAPLEFTAPNLQYLMDSPVEFGPISTRQFSVDGHVFKVAVHHAGTEADVDDFAKDVEKIVRQEEPIYGEFPAYEPGSYTFIADYLPYADEDGMEHRNSAVLTSSSTIRSNRTQLLDSVAHELFHSWNVERIRPRSLEPFDLERENMSGELWLAEGFTEYFGPLTLSRAGIASLSSTAARMAGFINAVAISPASRMRSAEEMSRMALYTDDGPSVDRTNFSATVISYYPFGGAIALGLDLTLRARSDSRVSLNDYMRAMWTAYGKPGGSREGYVDRPYTVMDAEARLADVSGDRAFARDFFARYIQGHDVLDYAPLLLRAGLRLRKINPGGAWWGNVSFETRNGALQLSMAPPFDSPAYAAGLDEGDDIRQMDGARVASLSDITSAISRHRPGDRIAVVFTDRSGQNKTTTVVLAEDPRVEIAAIDAPSTAQRDFRDRWLGNGN